MSLNIRSPKHSFVQFGISQFTGLPTCDGHADYVLPVASLDDLAFQFLVEASAPDIDSLATLEPELYLVPGLHGTYPGGGALITLSNVRRYLVNASTAVFLWDEFTLANFNSLLSCNQCFQLWIKIGEIYYPSNKFQRICGSCHTAQLTYYCEENSYGFEYCSDGFANKVRLPVKLLRPQFVDDDIIYNKSNGSRKVLSSITSKERTLVTQWNNELFHERLKIALSHDDVHIADDLYTGGIVKTGPYELEWPEFLNHPLGQARVKVNETPYNVKNTHCVDCVQQEQMELQNDVLGSNLEGAETYNINTASNDKVFCSPFTYSIHSINTMYVQSATITPQGILTIVLKDPVMSASNVVLVTYKVTCANGQYKTVLVRGTIVGETSSSCDNVTDVSATSPSPGALSVTWTNVSGISNYIVRVLNLSTNSFNDYTASASPYAMTGLVAGDYEIIVFTVCGEGLFSSGTNPETVTIDAASGGGETLCFCYDDGVYTIPEGRLCRNGSTPDCYAEE